MALKPIVLPLFAKDAFFTLNGKKVYFRPADDPTGFQVTVGKSVEREAENHEPIPNGLYDYQLGPAIAGDVCPLCDRKCEGHSGYIELPEPVFKGPFFDDAKKLLSLLCPNGHGVKDPDRVVHALKNRKSDTPFDRAENEKIARFQLMNKHCRQCQELFKGVRKPKLATHKIVLTVGRKNQEIGKSRDVKLRENIEFFASDFEKVFNHDIYTMHKEIFDKIHGGYFQFITRRIEVLPSTCRPLTKVRGEWSASTYFNENYRNLLKAVDAIEDLKKKPNKTPEDLVAYTYRVHELQKQVNLIWERVKSKLNRKQGMIRSNVLGKRIDHCARSVITPDSFIDVDEMGIPEAIAKRLEVPQSVTQHNYREVLSLIESGNAHYLQFEDGSQSHVKLARGVDAVKKKLRNPVDFVEQPFVKNALQVLVRPLMDGDIVFINRQPTLHKASMMAHRVRVIRDKNYTLRLHVGACKPYNADFDGDEMNVHIPQTIQAQTEARLLASIQRQYFSPRDGSPQIGLIQDHVVSGLNLTLRNTFLTPEVAQELLASEAVRIHGFKMPPPAILKAPNLKSGLYTGKQIVSALIQNYLREEAERNGEEVRYFNMTSKAKVDALLLFNGDKEKVEVSDKIHPGEHKMRDSEVIIREGELCVGVIDKNQIGTEKFGLIHTLFWLYTADVASRIVSALGRVFDEYLMRKGFSVSTTDVMLEPVSAARMRNALAEAEEKHLVRLAEELSIPPPKKRRHKQKFYDEIRQGYAQVEMKKDGNLLEKVKAVSRETGKILADASKIGKPVTIFPSNNFSMMIKSGAKGSQVNHNQLAFFVGQMDINGAPPPRMINGQTLHNVDPWDPSMKSNGFVMNSYASGLDPSEMVFTTMAGRSGLVDTSVKTATSGYLQRALMKKLEDLTIQYDGSVRDAGNRLVQVMYGSDGIDPSKSDTLYHDNHFKLIANNMHVYEEKLSRISELGAEQDKKRMKRAKKQMRKEEAKYGEARPMLHHIPPFSCLGAVSDKFKAKVESFAEDQIDDLETKERFKKTMELLYKLSAAEPGEPIGVAAAHSIGEPSTQMTLNTFHLAGSSDVNITMGLPRLRQLLQFGKVAESNVNIPVAARLSQRKIEKLQQELMVIRMIDLVKNISMEGVRKGKVEHRILELELVDEYRDFGATEQVLQAYALRLTKRVPHEMEHFKELVQKKKKLRLDKIKSRNVGFARKPANEGEGEGDEAEGGEREEEDEDEKENEVDYEDDPLEAENSQHPRSAVKKPVRREKSKTQSKALDNLDPNIDPETYVLPTFLSIRVHFQCVEDGKAKYHIWSRSDEIDVALLLQCIEKEAESMCVRNEQFRNLTQRWVARKAEGDLPERLELQLSGNIDKLKEPVIKLLKENYGKFDVRLMDVDSPTLAMEFFGKSVAKELMAREVQKVFSFYGITVDERHLALVTEYLTIHGEMKGAHRSNYKHDEPLQAASFEQGSAELVHNVLRRGVDKLANSSARHFVGLPPKTGTGSVTVMQQLPKVDFSDSDWV